MIKLITKIAVTLANPRQARAQAYIESRKTVVSDARRLAVLATVWDDINAGGNHRGARSY